MSPRSYRSVESTHSGLSDRRERSKPGACQARRMAAAFPRIPARACTSETGVRLAAKRPEASAASDALRNPPPRNTPLRIGSPHARARAGAVDPLRGGAQPTDPPTQLRSGVPLRGATGRALKRNSTVSKRTPNGPAGEAERGKHNEGKRHAEQVRSQGHAGASQSA